MALPKGTKVTMLTPNGKPVDVTSAMTAINITLQDKVMQRAQADVSGLIEEHMDRIFECMQKVHEDSETAGEDNGPAYKVALSVTLVPFGRHTVNVSASITYGTKIKDETKKSDITDHPELPLGK